MSALFDKKSLCLCVRDVQVLDMKDVSGNSEWWYIERADGRKGFIPAAFLGPVGDFDESSDEDEGMTSSWAAEPGE